MLGFRIIGDLLTPEHCHLLIWPGELADPSRDHAEAVGAHGQLHPAQSAPEAGSAVVPKAAESPTVHHHARYRVGQRGGYDMKIWSEKKLQEKLTCITTR